MRMNIFIGIDYATRKRRTGFAVLMCEKTEKPVLLGKPLRLTANTEIIDEINNLAFCVPRNCILVAIDAPLSYPELGSYRNCELVLRAQGIMCYPSGASWTKKWVSHAIKLKRELEIQGFECMEVYPYATRKLLSIGTINGRFVRKQQPESTRVIQNQLAKYIRCIPKELLGHDELDAILAAYTAYLRHVGRCEKVGDELWVPMRPKSASCFGLPTTV